MAVSCIFAKGWKVVENMGVADKVGNWIGRRGTGYRFMV
jgi:hypothetical protein